jgi:hypothetical protein
MSILITTESLKQVNACSGAIEFFTGSFCVSSSEFYKKGGFTNGGLGNTSIEDGFIIGNYKSKISPECQFNNNEIYHFSCSNAKEVGYLIWAATKFKITGSFYNKEKDHSQYYYYMPKLGKEKFR